MHLVAKLLGLLVTIFFAVSASAGSAPFNEAAFNKAVSSGEPVIVQFHATWCPTCKAQAPLVEQVLKEPKMKDVKLFVADFDTEKALKKSLKVSTQSTFVAFKGGKEVTRSTGQTSLNDIEAT